MREAAILMGMKMVDILALGLGMIAFVSLMGSAPTTNWERGSATLSARSTAPGFLSRPYDAAMTEAEVIK